MALEYLPLLSVQRNLYSLPRGMERFREYLKTMIDADTGELGLPLTAMNPMGKDHVPALLDRLLAMDADGEGARAMAETERALKGRIARYKIALVVTDDAMGGWTNRFATEFDHRFRQGPLYKRGFIVALLWTSEEPAPERVRDEVAQCIFRAAHVEEHGHPETLGEMLDQETHVLRMAGASTPILASDDLEYTRHVLGPYLRSKDHPVIIAALFGDQAATQLGYRPLGLSPRAGLALALADAIRADAKQ